MKHLTNFSVYKYDVEQFDNIDSQLPDFLKNHSLDGLEVLIGYEQLDVIPRQFVTSVHLPFWVTWLEVWKGLANAAAKYFGTVEEDHVRYLCGGRTKENMIEVQAGFWREAARLGAAYAVIHACHVELEHAFTRKFPYSSSEVLTAFAQFLNATASQFPDGEPPVCIAIENLWWPGLTFTNHDETKAFTDQLKFTNWCFVLDTGHLLNTTYEPKDEKESIDFLLNKLNDFPVEVLDKMDVLHLSYSCTGEYQRQSIAQGLPEGYAKMSFTDRFKLAREHASAIDNHNPFSLPQVNDVIQLVNPKYLVHEFLGTIEKRTGKIKQQVGLAKSVKGQER